MIEEEWRKLGKLYIENARKIDPWRATIHGIVHTQLLNVNRDWKAIKAILKLIPKPDLTKCPINPSKLKGYEFYSHKTVSETICDKVEHIDKWLEALKSCDREKLRTMKKEGVNVRGLGWKGIDMALLDAGCDNTVIDIHLARYLARTDPEFLKALGLRKYDPESVDRKVKIAQNYRDPIKYDRLWELARRRAEKEGVPLGEWHVATWLKERFRNAYPNLSERKRLELAKKYVKKLFS